MVAAVEVGRAADVGGGGRGRPPPLRDARRRRRTPTAPECTPRRRGIDFRRYNGDEDGDLLGRRGVVRDRGPRRPAARPTASERGGGTTTTDGTPDDGRRPPADDARRSGDADGGGGDDERGPSPGCGVRSAYRGRRDDAPPPPRTPPAGPSSAMVDFAHDIEISTTGVLHSGRFDEIVGTKMVRLLALLGRPAVAHRVRRRYRRTEGVDDEDDEDEDGERGRLANAPSVRGRGRSHADRRHRPGRRVRVLCTLSTIVPPEGTA